MGEYRSPLDSSIIINWRCLKSRGFCLGVGVDQLPSRLSKSQKTAARWLLLSVAVLSCLGCSVSLRSPITTGSTSDNAIVPKTAVVKTADEASTIALETARETLNSLDPQVIQVRLMVPAPGRLSTGKYVPARSRDDPANLVWLVDVDQDGHDSTPCPAPPPGIDQTICWYPDVTASIAVSVMRGIVVAIGTSAPKAQGTPYAMSFQIPTSAKLPTREDAMAAGFKLVPGKDGAPPTIIDVRALKGADWIAWLRQQGIRDDLSDIYSTMIIWVLEFTHAALALDCTSDNATSCVHDHLYLSLDAESGKSLGFVFPASGTPANFTP